MHHAKGFDLFLAMASSTARSCFSSSSLLAAEGFLDVGAAAAAAGAEVSEAKAVGDGTRGF